MNAHACIRIVKLSLSIMIILPTGFGRPNISYIMNTLSAQEFEAVPSLQIWRDGTEVKGEIIRLRWQAAGLRIMLALARKRAKKAEERETVRVEREKAEKLQKLVA